jgi:hypothetical protein
MPNKPTLTGEERIFLMQTAMTTAYGGNAMAKFLLDEANIDRILAIREALGNDIFEAEITKLKGIMSSIAKEIVNEDI